MYQSVKVTFPFADNIDKGKPRPALVISPSFGKHNQIIVAYITSNVKDKLTTDVVIDVKEKNFHLTGLRSPSVIKLHRLITVTPERLGLIGNLPKKYVHEVKEKLLKIFQLK